MIWNSDNSTYYDHGRKAYSKGDKLPAKVTEQMGKETLEEYKKKGLIVDGKTADEAERNALLAKAEGYGLKPHYRAGIEKLQGMIKDHETLQALKKEALELGIDPRDDVTFEELTILVDEKLAENESDS